MELDGVFSVLLTGLVVGALGRLVLPGRQPIGCLVTVLLGIAGAAVGLWVADAADIVSVWLTLAIQVAVAAVLVAVVGGATRSRWR